MAANDHSSHDELDQHQVHSSPSSKNPTKRSQPERMLSHISLQNENIKDIEEKVDIENAAESGSSSPAPSSIASNSSKTLISFDHNDPGDPENWGWWKKSFCVFTAIVTVINSTLSSSLAAGISKPLTKEFHITSNAYLVLATSCFLLGYTIGPLFFGPLSESYGRKGVMIYAFTVFTLFQMACALAPNYSSFLFFRFVGGVVASCPISVVGGICADVYHNPVNRGRSMAIFMAATCFGPVLGPIISGYIGIVEPITWRWSFWVALMLAAVSWIPLLLMPETYAPVILKKRARKLRKAGQADVYAPIELEKTNISHIITVVLTRPVRMFFFEAIVLFTCLYLSFAYSIFYIFFQSYPIIFINIYDFSPGQEGLTFIPIGVGAVIACFIYLAYDNILQKAKKANRPWSRSEEFRRLPLACLAGPFLVSAMFWCAWTARDDIHWAVPAMSGVLFGIGYLLIFMALLNYLVDAYDIFAASAMAAAGTTRSTCGSVLPFAAKPMYDALGVAWATSLLGFFAIGMAVIPFVFIKFGDKIRARSVFCQEIQRGKEKEDEERRRKAAEAGVGLEGDEEAVVGTESRGESATEQGEERERRNYNELYQS